MRRALLIVGLLTLAALWCGPLPVLTRRAFFWHMTLHMGVVAVAAPLLALGLAGGRRDPVPRAPRLFAPIPASVLELVVVWTWHSPAMHRGARHDALGLVVEQAMFLACGLLVWLSAFGGGGLRAGSRTAAGVVGLLLTSMHMTLLGSLLALAPRPLYSLPGAPLGPLTLDTIDAWGEICGANLIPGGGDFGLAPLEDQHLGGAIMLLVGGASYLLGGLWLTAGLLQPVRLGPAERA